MYGELACFKMASKNVKKSTTRQTRLDSPNIKQANMEAAAINSTCNSRSELSLMPEDNTLLQLVKTELITSRSQVADTIKTEMASFRSEIGLIVETFRSEVKTKMDALQLEITGQINSMQSKQSIMSNTMDNMETTLNSHHDSLETMETTVTTLKEQIQKLQEQQDDLENRSRRQNLRIIGIPEDAEKGRPTDLMSGFFSEVLGEDLPGLQSVVLDRAHRALAPKPRPGDRPRAMIIRLHYFSDKAKILQASRKRGELTFRGARVHIFPDMSAELSRKRAAFNSVKLKLKQAGISYGIHHPADLRFTFDNTRLSFKSASEAEAHFEQHIKPKMDVRVSE